jgi:hypothetical protein
MQNIGENSTKNHQLGKQDNIIATLDKKMNTTISKIR